MNTARRRRYTKQLLTHYLTLIAKEAGVNLDGDCVSEIGSITDLIFDEITEQCAAVDERRERLAQQHPAPQAQEE